MLVYLTGVTDSHFGVCRNGGSKRGEIQIIVAAREIFHTPVKKEGEQILRKSNRAVETLVDIHMDVVVSFEAETEVEQTGLKIHVDQCSRTKTLQEHLMVCIRMQKRDGLS